MSQWQWEENRRGWRWRWDSSRHTEWYQNGIYGAARRDTEQAFCTRRLKKSVLLTAVLLLIIVGIVVSRILWYMGGGESAAYTTPQFPRADLGKIISELAKTAGTENISMEDYQLLQQQTGLYPPAIDYLLRQGEDGQEKILLCQENMYESLQWECRKIGFFTREERRKEVGGAAQQNLFFPDLKNGDVLITNDTHTLGWRHGHAAIVVDASRGKTLESVYWGEDSCLQSIQKWEGYPHVLLFRLKDAEKKIGTIRLGDAVAAYAEEYMADVHYGLLSGLPYKAPKNIKKTQCAHLVWSCFNAFGYDVDFDGGWLVTPKDLVESGYFELIQTFGGNEF